MEFGLFCTDCEEQLLELIITGIWGMRKGHCITASHHQKPGGAVVEPRASMDRIKHQGVKKKRESLGRAQHISKNKLPSLAMGLNYPSAALAQLAHTLLDRAGLLHGFPRASKAGRRGPHSRPLQLEG